mgnify:FL=1|tara:strand:- start:27584 stop:28264 length:681 start_codon:yes stop_codon:yes gene_type:complete
MIRYVLAIALLASCGDDKKDDPATALPVANSWNSGASSTGAPTVSGDPHAGLDMGGSGDPHAGLDMGGGVDPHAGLDMGGGVDPHAGLDMGGENPGGLMAPDPNREVDESQFVAGSIASNSETAALIKAGAIVFLSVRPINKVTGDILGQPLAVERIDVRTLPIDFRLSGANSMVAGTDFSGDVEVYARVDHDGEASSVQPGDIEGRVRTVIPAKGLLLVLDSVVK